MYALAVLHLICSADGVQPLQHHQNLGLTQWRRCTPKQRGQLHCCGFEDIGVAFAGRVAGLHNQFANNRVVP
jgi:hypothetical protein